MLKTYSVYRDAALAAPRQFWLASLGAAVVTRNFLQNEARPVFDSLVKQGTTVESRAIRVVGRGIETSVTRANDVWRTTRSTVERRVRDYADQAVALAQQALPRSLPKLDLAFAKAPAKGPAKAAKKTRARKAAPRKRAKAATKR